MTFVWVGGGEYPNSLPEALSDVGKCGLADRVRFVGPRPDAAARAAAFDVFLLTSREDPYPLAALEAAAAGVPIVCFAGGGGMPEFVEDDCGVTVAYLDVAAMADAVAGLLADPARRAALGETARRKGPRPPRRVRRRPGRRGRDSRTATEGPVSLPGRLLNYLRTRGPRAAVRAVAARFRHRVWHRFFPERAATATAAVARLAGKRGIEVGGPTPLFQPDGILPVYPAVAALDNVNFSTSTVWEGQLADEGAFAFDAGRRRGTQYVREATDLRGVPDAAYDFLLSSHVVEHLADPIRGLREWMRVVRPGGTLLIVVPHHEGTFDHRRPVTPFAHLLADNEKGTGEDDLTALPEVLALHDLSRDPGADPAAFEARCRDNPTNRCMHHHVFDAPTVVKLVDAAGGRVLAAESRGPFHIIVLAEKPTDAGKPDNAAWLSASAAYVRRSPFKSDRASPAFDPAS